MTDAILLDTSVWVRFLRRGADADLVGRVAAWLAQGRAATTELVKVELLQAARTEDDYQRLGHRLEALPNYRADEAVFRDAARNGFKLRRSGVIIPTVDLVIATIAQRAGATLAHFDRHYEMAAPVLGIETYSLL